MCKVKIGKDIICKSDLQNLITASILRESEPYSIKSMLSKVENECEGSPLEISQKDIEELINNTTLSLLRCEYLDSIDNKFYSRCI
jgi:hypothetical protein